MFDTYTKRFAALGLALTAGVACHDLPSEPQIQTAELTPSFWVGCEGGTKFTGGGRIDPNGEKVTFGFNLHGGDDCEAGLKGQMEVVHHPTQSKFHMVELTRMASFEDTDGARCVEWEGTVRAMHGEGAWHEHGFTADACDRGEPGSSPDTGPDTFRFNSSGGEDDGHQNTGRTPLTGGNIQAH